MKIVWVKRIMCCMLFFIMCVLLDSAFARSSCINEGNKSLLAGGSNSYAWNEQYVFIAEGYFKDREDYVTWAAPHYRIIRQDRLTQERVVLVEDYPYIGVQMYAEEDSIYLLRSNIQAMNDIVDYWELNDSQEPMPEIDPTATEYTFYIERMSFAGECQDTMSFDVGEYICDFLTQNGQMYIATESCLFGIDVCSGKIQKIYTAQSRIKNERINAHMIEDEGFLYIRDGEKIVAVNAHTGEYDVICDFTCLYPMLLRFGHEYLVMNGKIYFWDETSWEMISIDLDSGERICISKDRYYFNQVTDEGISVFCIRESNLNKLYAKADYVSKNQMIEMNGIDYSIIEEFFYEFSDVEMPEFDLLKGKLIPFEAWDRVFFGDGEYMDDGDLCIQQRNQ